MKKMSSTLLHFPLDHTIVHRPKTRPFLGSPDPFATHPRLGSTPTSPPCMASSSSPSTVHSGLSSPTKDSTGKTSLSSSKDSVIEKKPAAGSKRQGITGKPSLDDLGPILENALDAANPTVVTVERVAAAKIFLETHFNELLSSPTPRSLRRRYMEGGLFHAKALSHEEKENRRQCFYRCESEYLRQTRVMKARSIRALSSGRGSKKARCDGDWEVLKVLGKGSFGVVRLVREKPMPESLGKAGGNREVYAMKVIRKSDMLRSSQEGHLRAERDFLVASEGSRW